MGALDGEYGSGGGGRRHSDGAQHWSFHPPSSSQFPQQASFHFQKQFGRTKTGNSAKFVNSGRSPPNLFLSGNYLAVTSGMDATPIQNLQNLHASLDGQRGLWGAIWPRRGNPGGDLCRVVEWGNLDGGQQRERGDVAVTAGCSPCPFDCYGMPISL